jgi:hypothetical protein
MLIETKEDEAIVAALFGAKLMSSSKTLSQKPEEAKIVSKWKTNR